MDYYSSVKRKELLIYTHQRHKGISKARCRVEETRLKRPPPARSHSRDLPKEAKSPGRQQPEWCSSEVGGGRGKRPTIQGPENFLADGNVLGRDPGGDYTDVRVCQNAMSFTSQRDEFYLL